MRSDVFEINKSVHIKLNKDLYVALKIEAFQRGLTLQEIFTELSQLIVDKNPQISKLLDVYAVQRIKDKLKGKSPEKDVRSELDSDALYELIEEKGASDEKK